MAEDLGLDPGGLLSWAHSLLGSNINDATGVTSAAVDLGAAAIPPSIGYEIKLVGNTTGTVDGVVTIRVLWSRDGTDYDDTDRGDILYIYTPVVSATEIFAPSISVRARYFKVHIQNESGITILSSGSAVDYEEIWGDQA